MPYVPIEKLLGKCDDSIYKLVVMASKRSLEIAEGQPKLVSTPAATKPSTSALYEIAEGKLACKKVKGE